MTEAQKLAAQLAAQAPIAMRYILDAVNQGVEMPFAEGVRARGDAVRPGRRRPRTCARARARSSRSASREFKGTVGAGSVMRSDRTASTAVGRDGLRVRASSCRSINDFVTDRLQAGALAALGGGRRRRPTTSRSCACPARSRFRWPRGTRPRPAGFDAIVCLGCLIRGATPHFEFIASAVAHGLTDGAGRRPACR